MGYITQEEFDKMKGELLGREVPCYDMLLYITQNVVESLVYTWCDNDPALKGRRYEEDVMQEIYARVTLKTVPDFLLKEDNFNNSPSGFHGWLKQLARNKWTDFAKKVRKHTFLGTEIDENTVAPELKQLVISPEEVERLNKSANIVLGASSKPHIIITWFTQFVVIAKFNLNRIESNKVIASLGKKTLDEMFRMMLAEVPNIVWLRIKPQHIEKIQQKLDIREADGRRRGDMRYEEFYMKKGPIDSISDWINRMNEKVGKEEESK